MTTSKKKKGTRWKPFKKAVFTDEIIAKLGENAPDSLYTNNFYQVAVYMNATMIQLLIRKIGGYGRNYWMDMQRIKNELCGTNAEAVELYPSEERRQATATHTQLWVLPDGLNWPVGFGLPTKEESEDKGIKDD